MPPPFLSNDQEIAEICNAYFANIVVNLDIEGFVTCVYSYDPELDYIANIIVKFKHHPSILTIKERVKIEKRFSFLPVDESVRCDKSKPTTYNNIPTRILVHNKDIISPFTRIPVDNKDIISPFTRIPVDNKDIISPFTRIPVDNKDIISPFTRIPVDSKDIISPFTRIPVDNKDIISPFITEMYNESNRKSNFPNSLKLADVTPAHKKDERIVKGHYSEVSRCYSCSQKGRTDCKRPL